MTVEKNTGHGRRTVLASLGMAPLMSVFLNMDAAQAASVQGGGGVVRVPVSGADWKKLESGGEACILHQAPDRTTIVALLRESGDFPAFEYPFTESLYVFSGTLQVEVIGGATTVFRAGDTGYIPQGTRANLRISPDFQDFVVLTSDKPIEL